MIKLEMSTQGLNLELEMWYKWNYIELLIIVEGIWIGMVPEMSTEQDLCWDGSINK